MRLFISYAHKQSDSAHQLAKILRGGGHEVWIDNHLQAGQEWQEQLRKAIGDSDAVILAITDDWLGSEACNWEFITAAELRKHVVPVLLQRGADGKPLPVPERISRNQWADFSDGFNDRRRIQKFLDDLLVLGTKKPRKSHHLRWVAPAVVLLLIVIGLSIPAIIFRPPPPTRLPASGFNVIVAGFGFKQADGTLTQDSRSDDLSDITYGALSEMREIDYLLGWREAGHILAADPEEREDEAAQMAARFQADVVIYGTVSADEFYNVLEPEFYVTAKFAALEPELIGSAQLGAAVEVLAGSTDQELNAALALQRRLRVMRLFLRGLSLYIGGDFSEATTAFEDALAIDDMAVLSVFAGNAAGRDGNTNEAWQHYNMALEQQTGYERALIGKGSVLHGMNVLETDLPRFDPALKPDADCASSEILPETPQARAWLALACYDEAAAAQDAPSDTTVKAAFGRGQIYVWLSTVGYGEHWQDAQQALEEVTVAYQNAEAMDQARLRILAAHATANQGLILLLTKGTEPDAIATSYQLYSQAIELLQSDVNRSYNREWLDVYSEQAEALRTWLQDHGITPESGDL